MRTEYTLADLELAQSLARWAHTGQWYGDRPYFEHVDAVARRASDSWPVGTPPWILGRTRIAGYLHDVLEDTTVTEATLTNLFGADIAADVVALTRYGTEDYASYVARLTGNTSEVALRVKRADLELNLDGCSDSLRSRYAAALVCVELELKRRV